MRNFVGKTAYISFSDPWDFCTMHGPGPFHSTIVAQEDDEFLLLKLDTPIAWQGVEIVALVATGHLVSDSLAKLVYAKVACDFIGLPSAELPEGGLASVSATDGPWLLGSVHLKGGIINMIL